MSFDLDNFVEKVFKSDNQSEDMSQDIIDHFLDIYEDSLSVQAFDFTGFEEAIVNYKKTPSSESFSIIFSLGQLWKRLSDIPSIRVSRYV